MSGEALSTLIVNKLRGTFKVCAVKAPGYGDRRKETVEVENDRRKGERRIENQTRNNGESEKDGE